MSSMSVGVRVAQVRVQPSFLSPVDGELPYGSRVSVAELGGDWVRIWGDGVTGWLLNYAVVGRGEAVTLYQPRLFSSALGAFHVGDFGVALSGFLALVEQDPVAAAYVKTCLGFVRKPPTDWNGVWRLDSK